MASTVATSPHRRLLRSAGAALACALALGATCAVALGATPAGAAAAPTGSLIGHVTAAATDTSMVPVAGIVVAATGPTGPSYSTITDANGFYELDRIPAAASYAVRFTASDAITQIANVALAPGTAATVDDTLNQPAATIAGAVVDHHRRALPGMVVGLSSSSAACSAGTICGPSTTTDTDGTYTLSVVAGSYALQALDGSALRDVAAINAVAGQATNADVRLGPASVPAGTAPEHAARDLRWLNAERARAGLPAGIVLNPRWAQECAAHDGYERTNGVLSQTENPQAPAASAGGGWAGLASILAQAHWTRARDPWHTAPIHLMQLFTPSLSVIGLDDSGGLQCATTYPGLLRTPVSAGAVTTYPADGARGVPPREVAVEAPFVPGQFVGLPARRPTGRELFVYLNNSGQTGQARVKIVRAALTHGGHAVAVRWVDNSTRTVGRYLTGAILIPVRPLHARTTYAATVAVQGRGGTLIHSWSFTTAPR